MRTIIQIYGGGDSSTGIPPVESKITIEDNMGWQLSKRDKQELIAFLQQFYDNGILSFEFIEGDDND